MERFDQSLLNPLLDHIGESCGGDRYEHERIAFAIRAKLPEVADIIVRLAEADQACAPKLIGPPPACPPSSKITAIQCAIFDNWPDGKYVQRSPNRYGMAIEVWTGAATEIKLNRPEFKTNVALMHGKQLKSLVKAIQRTNREITETDKKGRPYVVPDAYLDDMLEQAKSMKPDELVGMVNTNVRDNDADHKRGICYHPGQFVFVKGNLETNQIDNAVLTLDGEMDISFFSSTPYGKKPFGKGVILQSRIDLVDFFPLWATNSTDVA